MAARYVAGASGLPFGVLRGYVGTDLMDHTPTIAPITCPFTGEQLTAVPALNPDVAVIHAQQADRRGNVQLWGLVGVQKEAVLSARRSIVTVEEVVDELTPRPERRRPAGVGGRRGLRGARAAPTRASPSATRRGTTSSTGPGTTSAATGRRSRPGSTSTSGARPTSASTWPASGASRRSAQCTETVSADDVMIVNAARCLSNDLACFVGIGLPSTAANLARRLHAPDCVLDLRVRVHRLEADPAAAVHRRRRAGRDLRRRGQRARDLRLLAAGRAHRRRLPRRRAARPLRQHQLDRHRRLRPPHDPPARRRRRAGDRGVGRGGHRDHPPEPAGLRRALRLRDLGRLRPPPRRSSSASASGARDRRSSSPTSASSAPTR